MFRVQRLRIMFFVMQNSSWFLLLLLCGCVNSLRFEFPVYNTSVPETYPVGGYAVPSDGFLQVTCISTTTGEPTHTVEYSITDGDRGPFEISSTNGGISVTNGQILDYETAESYSFTVMCTDTFNATTTATATVVIAIDPVNEFDPVPTNTSSLLLIPVPETTPIGTIIASTQPGGMRRYSVTDQDAGPNGVISYTLLANQTDAASFSLDQTTGALVLVQSLDVDNIHSSVGLVSVRIVACDEHPPRQDCPSIDVSLVVLQENDNDPVFSADIYEISLPESSPVGTIVATPECTDEDIGAGQYEGIQLDSDESFFSIPDEVNGTVILNGRLNYTITSTYNITLRCSDTGDRSSVAYLIITNSTLPSETTTIHPISDSTSTQPSIDETLSTQPSTNGSVTTQTTRVPPNQPFFSMTEIILLGVAGSVLLVVIIGSVFVCLFFWLHKYHTERKQVDKKDDSGIEMSHFNVPCSVSEEPTNAFDNRTYMTIGDCLQPDGDTTKPQSIVAGPPKSKASQAQQNTMDEQNQAAQKETHNNDNASGGDDNQKGEGEKTVQSITINKDVDWDADGDTHSDETDIDWGTVSVLPKKPKGVFQRK